MILDTTNNWRSPVRSITAVVESYNGSTFAKTYTAQDALKSFSVERVGEESKFFGFGICQKANVHLIDKDRLINITTDTSFSSYISAKGNFITTFPIFYVTEVHRDENTNELSVTAYDKLYAAAAHTVAELGLAAPYTIRSVAEACSTLLGIGGIQIIGVTEENNPFDIEYPEGANFEGTETIREALNAIAEATQTIYYINRNQKLIFKRLDINGAAALTIGKEDYIELSSKTNRRLSAICSATELGDNVIATLDVSGSTQYVRDNPFWDIQENVAELVENALAAVGGLTINQFECSWRGNPALEIGDKIDLIAKDGSAATSFVLNDTFSYDGSLSEQTAWHYEDNAESEDNPSTLGEVIKKTYARVDKANAEIEIVAGETAAIKVTTDSVQTAVTQLDNNMTDVINTVNTKVTAEEVNFSIQSALSDGIEKVTTSTGFTFNEEGLHISKENSEVTTTITEDGMTVYRKDDAVLTADNLGVRAEDLHATTFLIVGNNSRFEDFDGNRTGCFYIGKSEVN